MDLLEYRIKSVESADSVLHVCDSYLRLRFIWFHDIFQKANFISNQNIF